MKSLNLKGLVLAAAMLASADALADVPAGYFRVWEGFRRADLSEQKFLGELPSFMADTVKLYGDRGVLSNYIVVMPPKEKPAFIPDELALVALTGEADYRKIRETPEGQAYSARHWDVFDRSTSRSAPQFIDYQRTRPSALVDGSAYDMVGKPIDWSTGYSLVYIGIRKSEVSQADFLKHLQAHIELAHRHMVPQGLRGYIVTAHENYEVAYLNWTSKAAHDQALASLGGKAVFADAGKIMNALMYQEATQVTAGIPVENSKAYSTVRRKGALAMKALIVVTSHDRLGDTGKKTGYYLPEVSHPFFELKDAGFQVDIGSPTGGKAPMDERSRDLSDEKNREFLETPAYASLLENTIPLSRVQAADYDAIIFAGGHGTMWDFPNSADVQRLSTGIYEQGGVVAAVCHGPAALVNVRLSNGEYLISGKRVTGFTNAEEDAAELTQVMPFLLETQMIERGARFEKADLWQPKVVTDGRLVTGQNPASAAGVGAEVARVLKAAK
jgi:putative intracellular protease/amidase